ncbi:TerD family protein [Pseudonocardia sp.]|uniref:TerD family protein n=1 Tax=Pseudonocardia sp. TaxID=60912 RepID=UPI00263967EB|nr:TerD family protein [Pseudonocardia sp.]
MVTAACVVLVVSVAVAVLLLARADIHGAALAAGLLIGVSEGVSLVAHRLPSVDSVREEPAGRAGFRDGKERHVVVSLAKGGNVSLSKEAPGLTNIVVGLGWDVRTTTGADYDLDASAILLNESGKVISDRHFVFFNNLTSPDGTVEHTGDNLTGEGEGDDEALNVNLAAMAPEVAKIVFPVSIYEADARSQSFGQVNNAFIRVVNAADQREIARFDLSEDASTETAMVFGEVYRHGGEWKFRAVGQGYASGLAGIARDFGVNV